MGLHRWHQQVHCWPVPAALAIGSVVHRPNLYCRPRKLNRKQPETLQNVPCCGQLRFPDSSSILQQNGTTGLSVRRYLYIVNDYSTAKSLSVSLSSWGVPTGSKVLINEISGRYINQVHGMLQ